MAANKLQMKLPLIVAANPVVVVEYGEAGSRGFVNGKGL